MPEPSTRALAGFTNASAARQAEVEARLLELPTSETFRTHLVNLTSHPHPFGTEANVRVGETIARAMENAGLRVDRYPYDVYVPEPGTEIHVALVTPVRLPLNNQEYILKEDPYSAHPDLGPGWNAYSGSGDVTAEVVYVNYGRKEDFEKLRDLGVSVQGKIVLARYGGNFRGHKAKYAEEQGAAGIVMYIDPADGGYVAGAVYPEGSRLNESAVQRGSLLTLPYHGDPLTPFEPALPRDGGADVHRLDPADVAFHTLPVGTLPYGSAVEILKRMQGDPVPSGWQGGLPFTYRLTGGPDLTVRLRVNQPRKFARATDIVGTLEGAESPDEWVLLGCHYDAWSFGTVDPNSGTAMLLTLADALGRMARDGVRPRRTVKIAHWDAEEYGIIGSTEWVEQFRNELTEKAVAYLNADMAAYGPTFGASAAPTLKGSILEAATAVCFPGSDDSLYDRWRKDADVPPVGNLGGGSDHIGFYMHLGVPSAGITMSGVAAYHTNYDNLAFYERFGDPDFIFGPAVARVNGILALRLANADLIPYDLPRYGADLKTHLEDLEKRAESLGRPVRLDALKTAAADLSAAAADFQTARDRRLVSGPLSPSDARELNRALIALEKSLLHEPGLQDRPWSRSLYTADDPFSGYASWMLPGLRHPVETANPEGLAAWESIYLHAFQTLTTRIRALIQKLHE